MRTSTSCLLLMVAFAAAAPHVLASNGRQLMAAQKCALPAGFPRKQIDIYWSPADLSAACSKGNCADCWCLLAVSYSGGWTPAVLKDPRLKSNKPQQVLTLYREVIGDCLSKTSKSIPNYSKVYATFDKCTQWNAKANYGWAFAYSANADPKKSTPSTCQALVKKVLDKYLSSIKLQLPPGIKLPPGVGR